MTIIGDLSFVHTFFLCTLLFEPGFSLPGTCCRRPAFLILLEPLPLVPAVAFFESSSIYFIHILLFAFSFLSMVTRCGLLCCCWEFFVWLSRCCVWLLLSALLVVVDLYFLSSLPLLSFLQAHRVTFCPYLDTSSIFSIFFLVLKVPRLLVNSLSAPLTFFFLLAL